MGYAQTIDPTLEKEMGQKKDDEKIDVFVIMRQQYDSEQLNRRANYYTTRAARREFVVNELKQFAEVSQYDIRQSLAEMERNGMVTEPKVLWMANALYFSATKQAIYDLAKRKDVEIIGFDEKMEAVPEKDAPEPIKGNRDITPNVTQVRADQVWDLGYTGQGIVLAIIDSGVNYNHLDLKYHLWDGGPEFPNHGWDFGSNDNDPMDGTGHGTHCAGIASGDGSGGRQTGMAPDVTLMCVKVLDNEGYGNLTDCCAGVEFAADHGADLFNISLGWLNASAANKVLARNTCVAALNVGMVGSTAAGNAGTKLDNYPIPNNVRLPGSCPPPYMDPVQQTNSGGLSCVVCVGNVGYDEVASPGTSHGPVTWTNTSFGDYPYAAGSSSQFGLIRPDVCAPGLNIISADYSNVSGYRISGGTSMSAPCVAGCMALMLSKNPELTPAEICRILEETAVSNEPGKSNVYGYGRVDALAAVNAVPDNGLSLTSYVIHDEQGNNNQQLNAGESVTMDMNLRCGFNALNGATLNITCGSEYVTITNGILSLPNFTAGQTQTVTGFAFSVDASAPIRQKMTFYADVLVGGASAGHFAFTLAVKGNTLVYHGASVVNDNNGNGILEPGETANLRVFANNIGNATARSVMGALSVSSNYLTIHNNTAAFDDIVVYEPGYADFSVTLAANASNPFPMPLAIHLVDAEDETSDFGFSLYNVTTTSNPQGIGTLTGAGTYGTGTTITLSAIADNSHSFISWKQGNTVVSYIDFSIDVSENADFVANFNTLNNVVPVGQATSQSYSLPTSGYYNYTLSQQIYTTEELGQAFDISSVAFFNVSETHTRNCRVYLKHTEKTDVQDGFDWELLSSEDVFYEGNITFTEGGWTTICFDRAFAYDGIHNVLVAVDDNTGSYASNLRYFRVFYTESDQSHSIFSDNINYNPYNISGTYGYVGKEKSQALFGITQNSSTVAVTVVADPEEGGVVSGGGSYGIGQPLTLTGTANPGYVFSDWTLGGEPFSYISTCELLVPGEAEYVAHFEPVDNNTLAVGQATSTNTLLPTYSYYKYCLSEQIYTADEIGGACRVNSIAFFNTGYEKTRNFDIFMVNTAKECFNGDTDWISPIAVQKVFSGEVVMAKDCWTTIVLDREFVYDGTSNLALIVDDNSGNWTNDHMSCRVYDADGYQAIRIYNDNTNYNPYNPLSYSGTLMEVKNQILLGLASTGLEENANESFCFVDDKVLYIDNINGKAQLNLIDVLGRTVKSVELTGDSCSIADLKAGVYIVRLVEGQSNHVQKIVIGD